MNLVFCIVAILFAFMGMLIRIGKADSLMTGFVRDFKKKMQTYDLERLRAFVAKMLYLCAGCFLIMYVGEMISQKMVTWLGIILFFGVMVYSARYTEEKDNFKKEGL